MRVRAVSSDSALAPVPKEARPDSGRDAPADPSSAGAAENLTQRLTMGAATLAAHVSAYAELLSAELEIAARNVASRLWAATALVMSLGLTLAIGAAWLIAATWNTSARNAVMAGLLGGGMLMCGAASVALNRRRRAVTPMLSHVMTEWAKDRQLLSELMGIDSDGNS